MNKILLCVVLVFLVFSFCVPVYAATYADAYTDWDPNVYAGFPDQSGGQWQPYDFTGDAHLEPDDWTADGINDGFDILDNDVQERPYMQKSTFHDGKGWIEIGADTTKTGLLIWVPGASIDGNTVNVHFEVRVPDGSPPVGINLRDIFQTNGVQYLGSWPILNANESGTFTGEIIATQLWVEIFGFQSASTCEVSFTVDDQMVIAVTETNGSTYMREGPPRVYTPPAHSGSDPCQTDTYDIVIPTGWQDNLTITASPDSPDVSLNGGNPGDDLVISVPVAGSSTHTVTVTAIDDNDVEGAHICTISHTVESNDPNYDGAAIRDVISEIQDDNDIFADIYNDWFFAYPYFEDQVNSQWQLYRLLGASSFKLEPDEWTGDGIQDGYDWDSQGPGAGVQEIPWFARGTFHDGKGWVKCNAALRSENDRALLIWYPGTGSADGEAAHGEIEARHVSGSRVGLVLHDIPNTQTFFAAEVSSSNPVASASFDFTARQLWLLIDGYDANDGVVEFAWKMHRELPDVNLTMATSVEGGSGDPNTVTPSVGVYAIQQNTFVDISAETYYDCPNVLGFLRWEGEGIEDPCSPSTRVYMDSAKTVTAVFTEAAECGDLCHPILSEDLDENCYIDFNDLKIISDNWLVCNKPECD